MISIANPHAPLGLSGRGCQFFVFVEMLRRLYTEKMEEKRKTGREPARGRSSSEQQTAVPKKLTWREERFIWAYIDNQGNGSAAAREAGYSPHTCAEAAYELLRKPHILLAVESEKARLKNLLNFTREKALKILVGQATALASDFTEVLKDPSNKENYAGLAEKEYAIEATKMSHKNGNEVKLISNSERRAIVNELWEKLGLDKDGSEADRVSFLERFARLGTKLGRSGSGGGQTGGEGSK